MDDQYRPKCTYTLYKWEMSVATCVNSHPTRMFCILRFGKLAAIWCTFITSILLTILSSTKAVILERYTIVVSDKVVQLERSSFCRWSETMNRIELSVIFVSSFSLRVLRLVRLETNENALSVNCEQPIRYKFSRLYRLWEIAWIPWFVNSLQPFRPNSCKEVMRQIEVAIQSSFIFEHSLNHKSFKCFKRVRCFSPFESMLSHQLKHSFSSWLSSLMCNRLWFVIFQHPNKSTSRMFWNGRIAAFTLLN
jgi:hypothetical protein